nr:hypothetical protein [Tanacetum cinerariifolium]
MKNNVNCRVLVNVYGYGVNFDDSNVIPDSPDMCEDDIQNDQNDVESDDERKANTTLAQELKECKAILAETSKSLGESTSVRDSFLVALQTKQTEFEKYKTFNDRTIDYDKLKRKLNEALGQLAQKDTQEMHADLKYVESLEKEIDELESDKAEFSDMYDVILQDCVSKDVMYSFALDVYLHKVKEYDCLAQKLSKQTESVSKNDTVCNEKALNVFRKEHEQYFKIQDLKAKLQDKNIAISELKKLIEKGKGKSVDTKFDRPSVVQQPNAQRIPKLSVLGKPAPFSKSLERIYFSKTKSVPKTNVSEGLSKPATAQTLPQIARTKKPTIVPISTRKPKIQANKSVATHHKKQVASKSINQKPQSYFRMLYENTSKAWKCWIEQKSPPGYKWVPKTKKQWVPKPKRQWVPKAKNDHVQKRIVQFILFIVDPGCTKHITGNLKLLCNFVEKFLGTVCFGNDQFASILGYVDLAQRNVTINRVYYVKGLNHNLFSVGQFCYADLGVAFKKSTCFVRDLQGNDLLTGLNHNLFSVGQFCYADLGVAFRKSTCFVRDLQGNDLLTGNRGSDLYTISLQESTSSTPLCLMAKATPTQAWLWHRSLSHLNFDYINLLSKKDIVIGLPKLKSVERISHDDSKKSLSPVITVRTDRGTKFLNKTLNAFFKEEGIEHQTSTARTPKQNGASEYDNPDPVSQRQDVSSSADVHVPSQQELDLLFGPLYDEFFNAGSTLQDKQPSTNIPSTSAPSTRTNVHAEENNNDQAEEGEHLQDDEFTNPFCALT